MNRTVPVTIVVKAHVSLGNANEDLTDAVKRSEETHGQKLNYASIKYYKGSFIKRHFLHKTPKS